jgi:predicted enzyme related to lactoylglutathione lyase
MASIVLFAEDPERTASFYRALGVVLKPEDHDEFLHLAGDVNGVHFAVYRGATSGRDVAWREAGNTFVGFWVESLEATRDAVMELGSEVLQEHQCREWGCRTVVTDPDGRTIELNQRDHCTT